MALAGLSIWSCGRDATIGAEGHACEWSVSVTSGVVQAQLIRGDWEPINAYPSGPPDPGPWRWRSSFHQVQPRYRWWGWSWFRSTLAQGSNTFAAAPLWSLSLAALGTGTLLLITGRSPASSDGCPSCGYDRRGLMFDAVCPECGNK